MRGRGAIAGFGTVLIALAVTGVLLALVGANPVSAYAQILAGAFGSVSGVTENLVYATPIILTSLSVIIAFSGGLWNIGADGQLYLGAIAAVGIGFNDLALPGPLVLPAMALGALLAGAAWAAVPVLLRLRFGASEVIVTIMGNFLAVTLATYLIGGPWASGITPATRPVVAAGFLPVLVPGTRLHAGFLIALAAAVALSWLLRRTVFGYRLRVVGQNPNAARYAGIPVPRIMFVSFAGAGALAGLAGFCEVAGLFHNLPDGLSSGYGYTGIVVALLARLDPRWAVAIAIVLAALNVGAGGMQRSLGIPVSVVDIMEGLLILLVLARSTSRRPASA